VLVLGRSGGGPRLLGLLLSRRHWKAPPSLLRRCRVREAATASKLASPSVCVRARERALGVGQHLGPALRGEGGRAAISHGRSVLLPSRSYGLH
jgi:hypothetical protein